MIQIAIIDDNKEEMQELKNQLNFVSEKMNMEFHIHCFLNGKDFLKKYRKQYDLLCLDIDMPSLDGIALADSIRKLDKHVLIIFITHMAQMAIRGYEVQAVDFVLKPVNRYSLLLKMERIAKTIQQRTGIDLVIPSVEGTVIFSSHDLYYVEVSNHDLFYHTTEGVYKQKASMKDIEKKLEKCSFIRCNNCYLVNLRRVSAVNKDEVRVGTEWLKISRSRKKAFLEVLTNYIEGDNF